MDERKLIQKAKRNYHREYMRDYRRLNPERYKGVRISPVGQIIRNAHINGESGDLKVAKKKRGLEWHKKEEPAEQAYYGKVKIG